MRALHRKLRSLVPVTFLVLILPTQFSSANNVSDMDYDRVADEIDKCLNTPQLSKANKCSKYSVLFSKKELSAEPSSVAVDKQGCALDTDKDGVLDYLDYCPDNTPLEISAGVSKNGCPRQSDKDGTPDYRDRCKDTQQGQKTDRYGCPI